MKRRFSPNSYKKLAICAIVLIASGPFATKALAWSALGHRTVADVASRHLTKEAESEVRRLLALEGKEKMREVASWADQVKKLAVPAQPSHVVHLNLDDSRYDPATMCHGNRCVIGAIEADIAALKSKDVNDEARLLALKYLIHFVGDIHQPFHTVVDRGDVMYRGKRLTLHAVWDDAILAEQGVSDEFLAQMVDDDAEKGHPGDVDPVAWALEGRDVVRDVLVPAITKANPQWGQAEEGPPQLPSSYAKDNWPVARKRLKLAGLRLAYVLNDIFGGKRE